MNAISPRLRAACALLLLALCAAPYGPAQSVGSYEITQSVIAGGGGDSSGGSFSVTGTIGQAVTGVNGGGNYLLGSGFWGGFCPTITLSPATLPAATPNIAYTQQLTAAGGFGVYTYTLTGTPPAGFAVLGDTLSGTPTNSGVFAFTVTATDSYGCKGQNNYTLTVGTGATAYESDTAPRPDGNGSVSATDITQTRRFVAGTDTPAAGSEYQRADSAPRDTYGNGALSATDITQARRYAAATDPLTNAAGPNAPNGGAPQPARAQTPTARIVRVVSQSVASGNQVVVPVELDSQGDETALSFSLSYDPSILTLGGNDSRVVLGSGVPSGTTLTANVAQDAQGRLGIVLDSANAFAAGTRQLVTITFDITLGETATTISFGDQPVVRDISNAQAQSLSASYANGTVTLSSPTVAHIVKYAAHHFPEGNLLQWQTSFEVNNLGFHVWRVRNANCAPQQNCRERLTPNLIAGSALSYGAQTRLNSGYTYTWWDAGASADAVYWIEDVDLNGSTRRQGPVQIADCGSRLADTPNPARAALNAECRALANLRPASSRTLNQLNATDNATLIKGLPTELWKSGFNPQASESKQQAAGSRQSSESGQQAAGRRQQAERPQAVAAVKIAVRQAGWYRVTGAQIFAQGLEAHADARFLQLYADGQQIPLAVRTQDGRDAAPLGATGVIEFYATPRDTRETDTRTYWLIVGDTPGRRISPPARVVPIGGDVEGSQQPAASSRQPAASGGQQAVSNQQPAVGSQQQKANSYPQSTASYQPAANGGSLPAACCPPPAFFAYTVERKERSLYFAALSNGEEAENFFGAVVNQTPLNQTLPITKLDNAANTPAVVTVILQGATEDAHRVRVQLNGNELGVIAWTGRTRHTARFNLTPSALREGDNTLTLNALNANDVSLVDVLRVTYPRRYAAENNALLLTTGTRNSLTINGFTNNQIRVFDLTDPARAFQVAARVETDAAGYTVRIDSRLVNRTLFAVTDDQTLAPASLVADEPSHWLIPAHAADFLIIAPRAFRTAVAPLAQQRNAQGLQTEIVNLEDIYDELNGGDKSVQALRDFLRYARTQWQRGPQYVLFVGDASLDPRNYLNLGGFDLVPTGYVGTSYLETASDETLTDFDGDGIGEMSVGRLPARTPEQAALLINKTLAYVPHASDGGLFISDRPEGYDFAALSQTVRQQLPVGMPSFVINRADASDAATRQAIITALNRGPSLVNYAGHGSVEVWTNAPLLNTADALNLNNGNRLPLVVAMNCLNGYFQDVWSTSLAEGLLNAPQGGAVAVWASSALTTATAQAAANREFVRLLYQVNRPARLGDAARLAKQQASAGDVRRTWILFGDPTLTVH